MRRKITTSKICLGILSISVLLVYLYGTSVKYGQDVMIVSKDIGISNEKSVPKPSDVTKSIEQSKSKTNDVTNSIEQSKSLSNTKVKTENRTRYLIYLCDSTLQCGGFGDRQRGITGSFMMAIQLDRKFGVIMSTPSDLRQFYIPNKYNWIIPESELIGKPQKIIDNMYKGFKDLSNDTTEVIYIKTDFGSDFWLYRKIRHKLPPYLQGAVTRTQIFNLIWESLMKPTRQVTNHIKNLSLPINMTCAHVRIGKSKNLPNDQVRNNVKDVPKIWEFIETFDKTNTVFVATDNTEVRDAARRRFSRRYLDSGGKIVHMDRQIGLDGDCLGFETSLIDQIILSKCNVLIISLSGFSTRAAMMRNNPKDLYMFRGGVVKPFKIPN